jgi:hypothetical protein
MRLLSAASVARFRGSGLNLSVDPSTEVLGYFQNVRFADESIG